MSRSGFDEVSLRAVAAQAETSPGMVQRQFRDKDELLFIAILDGTGPALLSRPPDAATDDFVVDMDTTLDLISGRSR